MNILVVCQYYFPEPFRLSDICEELTRLGHHVTVITGLPNYPMGKIYKGYKKKKRRNETINGVNVHRCFTIGRRHGTVFRFLNYCSYALSSSLYTRNLKNDYDVILVNQLSPVIMASAATVYKKMYQKKLILYCLDLWPESLVAGGIKRKSIIFKIFHTISKYLYKQADEILVTSKSFSHYFNKEFGIKNTKYMPQYAEALFTPEQCLKKSNDTIDLMFAGNIGIIQNIKTIINAAKLTEDIPNLRWHIVGDGSDLENVMHSAKGMRQIFFHGRKPLNEMPKYYAMADAMIVTMQKDLALNLTLPGKVQTYMAAGKPIIGAIDGETQLIINEAKCGFCDEAENAQLLADNVRKFTKADRFLLGENARKYYESHFQKKIFMNELLSHLKSEKEK